MMQISFLRQFMVLIWSVLRILLYLQNGLRNCDEKCHRLTPPAAKKDISTSLKVLLWWKDIRSWPGSTTPCKLCCMLSRCSGFPSSENKLNTSYKRHMVFNLRCFCGGSAAGTDTETGYRHFDPKILYL